MIKKAFVWNIPNALTIFRFVCIGVFVALFLSGHPIGAVIVYCVAAGTDLLDGYLARKLNQVTDFGKLMDPLADKLMLIAALACLGTLVSEVLFILAFVIVKEMLMIIGGVLLYRKNVVVYAKRWGKYATVLFNSGVVLLFFREYIGLWPPLVVLVLAAGFAVISFAQAVGVYMRSRREFKEQEGEG